MWARVRDLLPTLLAWRAAGDPFVLATVVAADGGGPRELGAAMAVRMAGGTLGEVVGSVSGGCIEAAVLEVAEQVLADGRPRLETYGLTDAEAVGLTCGGTLSVFVEPVENNTRKEGTGDSGATHVLVKRQGDFWITLLGEVPQTTLQQFASAIEYKAPK